MGSKVGAKKEGDKQLDQGINTVNRDGVVEQGGCDGVETAVGLDEGEQVAAAKELEGLGSNIRLRLVDRESYDWNKELVGQAEQGHGERSRKKQGLSEGNV